MTRVSLPTRRADWRLVGRTLRLVLSVPAYAVLSVLAALVGLTGIVVSQNIELVRSVVIGGSLSLSARLETLLLLYPFVGPGFEPLTGVLVVLTALLLGANVALLAYHLREHDLSVKGGSGSLAGIVFGVLGAGCAACGPVVFAGVLSLLGATGVFFLLPLEGLEFAIAGVLLLGLSTYWLADGVRGGRIAGCPVSIDESSV
jgi:hypothetical protein